MSLSKWWHKIKLPEAETRWLTAKGQLLDLQMGDAGVTMMRAKWDLRDAEDELRSLRVKAGVDPVTGLEPQLDAKGKS